MVVLNYTGGEINAKIVYYGPGALRQDDQPRVHPRDARPTTRRGKMVSMKTQTDRTLFFDFLPLDLGEINGYRTRFLLYTVPGQVYYNATRKLVLKGVDAVVFVADSSRAKLDENLESLRNLEQNLNEHGMTPRRDSVGHPVQQARPADAIAVDGSRRALESAARARVRSGRHAGRGRVRDVPRHRHAGLPRAERAPREGRPLHRDRRHRSGAAFGTRAPGSEGTGAAREDSAGRRKEIVTMRPTRPIAPAPPHRQCRSDPRLRLPNRLPIRSSGSTITLT